MPLIPFPSVPALPGVPALPRQIAGVENTVALLAADAVNVLGLSQEPQWGVFDSNGLPIAIADSFVSIEYSAEWRVSDYPIEQGSFASYNKTKVPYDARVTLAKAGQESDRADFLLALEVAASGFDLYSVVTPERTYVDATLVHIDYRRASRNGVTMLLVEIDLREIRAAGDPVFSNTADPASASSQHSGTVQAKEPSPAESSAAIDGAG